MEEKKIINEGEELSEEKLDEVAGGNFITEKLIKPVLSKLIMKEDEIGKADMSEQDSKTQKFDIAKPL